MQTHTLTHTYTHTHTDTHTPGACHIQQIATLSERATYTTCKRVLVTNRVQGWWYNVCVCVYQEQLLLPV